MSSFAPIEAAATARLGADELSARLPVVKSASEIAAMTDADILGAMAFRIFAAGFRYRVITAKWDEICEAFEQFDPLTVAGYDADKIAELGNDRRVVRHIPKLSAICKNARVITDVAAEEGSVAGWIAGWPDDDVTGLWVALHKRFTMLGGASGPRFLRRIGKDTFVLTPDVLRALAHFGIYEGKGTGKRDRASLGAQFAAWAIETGRPQAHLSVILAGSID